MTKELLHYCKKEKKIEIIGAKEFF